MKQLHLQYYLSGILNSYSQIFFSGKKLFAALLLLVSFFDWFAGLSGLISVITSITLANILGFEKTKISLGQYSFNNLLVGLGIGVYFSPGWPVLFIILIASVLTLFLTIMCEAITGKYYLPYLSLPFVFSTWLLTLATRDFHVLELSARGLFKLNELYNIGGSSLVDLYTWWTDIEILYSLKLYFISLGAIFFQYNILAGIIISLGILYYSRIAFVLSFIGFYTAYLFYEFTGAHLSDLSCNYIGFNFILTSIAIGGFFLIPTRLSFLWSIILVPIVSIITISFTKFLSIYQLPIYSLPFNLVVIIFVYVIKARIYKSSLLTEPFIQQGSPEINLYTFYNSSERFKNSFYFPIKLPFWGEWTVTQGHNGEYTHKDEWQHAWDFEITDSDNKRFNGSGFETEDYYCFEKLVLAPAAGYVVNIIDGIPDNKINDVNTTDNWGNTIIIKHSEFLYSKMCHLRSGSFRVYIGEYVRQGQIVALCGNSGRSPIPHLHFQLQSTPYIGSKTLNYPLCYYISKTENELKFQSFSLPENGQQISNIEINSLLAKAFHFIPGQKLKWIITEDKSEKNVEWEVYTDIYNSSYIYCRETDSYAYFINDGYIFYFKHFAGNKKSALYLFFLSFYKVQLGFYKDLEISDIFPVHLLHSKSELFLQDFVAPFFVFINAKYKLHYISVDSDLSPTAIKLQSSTVTTYFKKTIKNTAFQISINHNGIEEIIMTDKKRTLIIKSDN